MIRIGHQRPGQRGLDIRSLQLLQQQAAPPQPQAAEAGPSAGQMALADVLGNDPFRPTEAPGALTGAARVAEILMSYYGSKKGHEREESLLARELARQETGDRRDAEQHDLEMQALRAELLAPERWSEPYDMNGVQVQRNSRSNQIEPVITPNASMVFQPPAGYTGTADALRPIPGGPADVRATSEGRARMQQLDSSARQLENALGVLDQALGQVGGGSAGLWGQVTRGVGGTDAYNLNQTLEPVRAILSFESLAEMRRNSATGGALGSIAVRELELLGNTVRSLDTAQSPAQLRRNIQDTRAQLGRTLAAVQAAQQEMGAGPGEAPMEPMAPEQPGPRRMRWNPETQQLENAD